MLSKLTYEQLWQLNKLFESHHENAHIQFREYDKSLNYEPGPMGLTPDHIKADPKWRYLIEQSREWNDKCRRVRQELSRKDKKRFNADCRAERDARRAAKLAERASQ